MRSPVDTCKKPPSRATLGRQASALHLLQRVEKHPQERVPLMSDYMTPGRIHTQPIAPPPPPPPPAPVDTKDPLHTAPGDQALALKTQSASLALPASAAPIDPQALTLAKLQAGVSMADIQKDPALKIEVTELQSSQDPSVQKALQSAAQGWLKDAITQQVTSGSAPDLQTAVNQAVQQVQSTTGTSGDVMQPVAQAANNAAVKDLLNKGVSLDQVEKNPALGQLLSTAQQSSDQGLKDKLQSTVKGWSDQALDNNLKGKEKDAGAQQGVNDFQQEMLKLAQATGLGDVIAPASEQTVKDGDNKIKDTANKGKSWWDSFTGAIGDVVGHVTNFFKKGFDLVGKGFNGLMKGVGDVYSGAFHLVGSGLNAVGLKSAGNFADKVGDGAQKAANVVGDVGEHFVEGVGDAVKGTLDGTIQMVMHPIDSLKAIGGLIIHPSRIVDVGKALWSEAMDGGPAHAAGFIAGNLIPMLLSGGAGGASLLSKAGEGVSAIGLKSAGSMIEKVAAKGATAVDVAHDFSHLKFDQAFAGLGKSFDGLPVGAQKIITKVSNVGKGMDLQGQIKAAVTRGDVKTIIDNTLPQASLLKKIPKIGDPLAKGVGKVSTKAEAIALKPFEALRNHRFNEAEQALTTASEGTSQATRELLASARQKLATADQAGAKAVLDETRASLADALKTTTNVADKKALQTAQKSLAKLGEGELTGMSAAAYVGAVQATRVVNTDRMLDEQAGVASGLDLNNQGSFGQYAAKRLNLNHEEENIKKNNETFFGL
jgi:hypothetical protein